MGKTVESFRIALEGEISRWSGFARALRKEDREAFGELKEMCCNNAMAFVMFVKFKVYCILLLVFLCSL
jgi:hypothetical protein